MDLIASPAKTRELMKKYGLHARKSLGQNFLTEIKFIDKIVAAADLTKDDIVIEIGPGLGALTQQLAAAAGYVLGVELDQDLVGILRKNFSCEKNISIIHGDALKVDFNEVVSQIPGREQFSPGFRVVANLPYYITTPVIMRLLEGGFDFSSLVLMVQKEVAQRMMAAPGKKDYGALSVGVQYHCLPSLVTIVPPTVFYPRPEVDSAVIKLTKREKPAVEVRNEALFFSLVRAAFGQRRKILLNALNNSGIALDKAGWQEVLEKSRIDSSRRGETLSLEEFACLANNLTDII